MNFFKIDKNTADLLTVFEYGENQVFNPYTREQVDGAFLIAECIYDLLKNTTQFENINFELFEKISENQTNDKNKSKATDYL